MYDFRYVTKKEAAPLKKEVIKLLCLVQNEVRKYFTFRFDAVGSSSRNMITCERNGNIGFDFDFNIEPNYDEEEFNPQEIRTLIYDAIRQHAGKFEYTHIENSTSVITIKAVDRRNSKIKYSCDFAIVRHYYDKGERRQKYIRYDKIFYNIMRGQYYWEESDKGFYIEGKINWLKKNGYWNELRDYYIEKKNNNYNSDKHSRSILAESVNNLYQKYHNDKGDSKAGCYFATVLR